jgi:hypothetical protein
MPNPDIGRHAARDVYPGESRFSEIQHLKRRAFLCAYSRLGSKARAAEVVGIDQSTIYTRQWREDPEFQTALERARVMAVDVLEDEVQRRAVEGIRKPTGWHKGKPGGFVREYSDLLLMFKTKAMLPEKYRDRTELRGSLATLDVTKLTDEQLAPIAAGEHPLGRARGVRRLG